MWNLPKRLLVVLPWLFVSPACGSDAQPAASQDPRLGELGQLRFTGGGGCSDSKTLALGSTARLTLEARQGALPDGLQARSTAPAVIEASKGARNESLVLRGVGQGSAEVEIVRQGQVFDRLGFDTAVAASATVSHPDAVFAGGTLTLSLDELDGECGKDCPLIGGELLVWTVEPSASMTLLDDYGRTTWLTATAPGTVTLRGTEPTRQAQLVQTQVTVLPLSAAGSVQAQATVAPPDGGTVVDAQPLPLTVTAGSLFMIELAAARQGAAAVPFAGRDIVWSIDSPQGAVEKLAVEGPDPAEGPIFSAVASGSATLSASVALLGATESYAVTVQ